ncbi:MAG: membrane protein insertase YidC [Rhodobacter sp.]|nr:membrane protein insertase YidC [Rhodobacter sp.]MCY4242597.1 membrane protein insertase YidC [Rhodobacter sp.]
MDDQNKNLIMATALSFMVILVWFILFPPEEPPAERESVEVPRAETPTAQTAEATDDTARTAPEIGTAISPESPRIPIRTDRLEGSIALKGGRIDHLNLKDYRANLAEESDLVSLLKPAETEAAQLAVFGWAPGGDLDWDDVPGAQTPWSAPTGAVLTTDSPLVLAWTNEKGVTYTRTISIDEDFLFTVTQSVRNGSNTDIRLAPYGMLRRYGEPQDLTGFFIIQEGPIRQSGEEMSEFSYGDLRDFDRDERWGAHSEVLEIAANGWLGFTDHYWMTTLVPPNEASFTSVLKYDANLDVYTAEARYPTITLSAGEAADVTTRLFAGAKEWETIRAYERQNGIHRFIDSIDWGWFFFLTKPIFAVLHWLNVLIGNMGWAIIGLTLIIKAVLFPLAFKSYVSMAKMKELQPEMVKIKERVGDDRQQMQQEMMALYKKEKVNPASGCLPILLQIPIFFSLYKVIFVTIELRHAPWLGWIRDLSAPDPSSILNLFGLLPYSTPDQGSIFFIFSLGVLPILLGISMWLQQKLNPAPTDPTQAMIFAWMPWVFMFMLGTFASGLIIYWIANNMITFAQQYLIMRSQGYRPDVFGNIIAGFRRKPKTEEK